MSAEHTGHEKHVCEKCFRVIYQCRCMGPKKVTYGICDICAKKDQKDDHQR